MTDNVIPLFPTTFDPNVPLPPEMKRIHCVVRILKGGVGNQEQQATVEVQWKKADLTAAWAAFVSYISMKAKNGAHMDVVRGVMVHLKRLPSHSNGRNSYVFSFEDRKVFEVRMMEL